MFKEIATIVLNSKIKDSDKSNRGKTRDTEETDRVVALAAVKRKSSSCCK